MKLSTKENSLNYVCTVVEIKYLHGIEGADRIQRCVLFNGNIVVSKDVKVGDVMLYFCSGTKLNEEFCKFNDLYSDAELNRDKTKKGYLGKQSRVRAIRLRNVISDGILLPLKSLEYINND